jgi:TDG/mug DNA glycosylase family protein
VPGTPEDAPLLPDILAPGLAVVFVGAAPSPAAARIGHYYAGQRNRFWQLLHCAGFTPHLLDPTEDHLVIRYGIGLTAVLPHLISTANDLLPEPREPHIRSLRAKIRRCAPRVVCYNGKDVYRMCTGEDAPAWGLLPDTLDGALQFVVHSSSGRADRWGADRRYLYGELYALARGWAGTPHAGNPYAH